MNDLREAGPPVLFLDGSFRVTNCRERPPQRVDALQVVFFVHTPVGFPFTLQDHEGTKAEQMMAMVFKASVELEDTCESNNAKAIGREAVGISVPFAQLDAKMCRELASAQTRLSKFPRGAAVPRSGRALENE